MATSSFDKTFVITNAESVNRFLAALSNPRTTNVPDKDLSQESKKGLKLIENRLADEIAKRIGGGV